MTVATVSLVLNIIMSPIGTFAFFCCYNHKAKRDLYLSLIHILLFVVSIILVIVWVNKTASCAIDCSNYNYDTRDYCMRQCATVFLNYW